MKPSGVDAISVAERGVVGLRWNYAGSVFRSLIQFGTGIVLARLLGPGPIGVMAVALILIGLGAMIADFGLTAALIQKRELEAGDVEFVSTCQIVLGFLLTALLALTANPVADFFGMDTAAPVIRAIGLIFALQAAGLTSAALLRREMKFGHLQAIQIISYVVGYALIGCVMAALGFGVWSLVAAQLAQTLIQTGLLLRAAPHRLISKTKWSPFVAGFGVRSLLSGSLSWMFTSLDNAVLGRTFGAETLGLFNRTSLTISAPTNIIVSGLQPVLFSALSKRQQNVSHFPRIYLGLMGAVSYLMMPVFAAIAIIPETFIAAIYGNAWLGAAEFVLPLTIIQPVFALMALGGPVLSSLDKVSSESRAQAISLVVFAGALVFAAQSSPVAIVWAGVLACLCRFVLVTSAVLKILDQRWSSIPKVLFGPAIFAILAAAAAFVVDRLCKQAGCTPLATLMVVLVAQFLFLALVFRMVGRRVTDSRVLWLLDRLPHRRLSIIERFI